MHLQYNSASYRAHYKFLKARYDKINPEVTCEPRVRLLCQLLRESALGVSIYSCEGHDNDEPRNEGYVMIAARNRDAASQLTEWLQIAMAKAYTRYGVDGMGEIESNIATWGEDITYPCIVIRSPFFDDIRKADGWWDLVTRVMYNYLKHYIVVNPENRNYKEAA